ncbi:MAG: molybdopterin molybdotransferase MoeA [Terriglobia bacterium]
MASLGNLPSQILAMTLILEQALEIVRKNLDLAVPALPTETLPIESVLGRVLAEDASADRDYPPFRRSARDGYAVRSADAGAVPITLRSVGESRAGGFFRGVVQPGECVNIMTGAPVPEGADAVVMVEHTRSEGTGITLLRAAEGLDNIVPRGSEAAAGAVVLRRGQRVDAGMLGLLASIGRAEVRVFRQPEVAILPTGDELVPLGTNPEWFQIRNSNSYSIAAQVALAGGRARPLGIAPDEVGALRRMILDGLQSELLLLSGGVSAGKYDQVETVLSDLGAEFYFDSVAIRPGKPVVFGRVKDKFFFGLPGNPISTYVTFEVFGRPTIASLSGAGFTAPILLGARLARPVKRREGLTAFVPARIEQTGGAPVVAPVAWQGSGDVAGFVAANCFILLYPDRESPQAGDWVDVMPKTQ